MVLSLWSTSAALQSLFFLIKLAYVLSCEKRRNSESVNCCWCGLLGIMQLYQTSELFYSAEKLFLNTEFLCCFVLGFCQVTSLSCDTTYLFYDNTSVACSELTTMLFPIVNHNNYIFSALTRKDLWNLIEWRPFAKCNTSICVL